jgi:cation transport protein ChaC
VRAWAFVVNRHGRDYAARLGLARTAELVLQGEGTMGRCRDYLESTVRHLERIGHRDLALRRLLEHVRAAERETARAAE